MNINDHFNATEAYLEMANEKVQRNDYAGARASLTEAHDHIHELLDQIVKLEVLKADIELSDEGA